MISAWYRLVQMGVNSDAPWQTNRHTVLCNATALIISFVTFGLALLATFYFGWLNGVIGAWAAGLSFLAPIALNARGYRNSSRLVLIMLVNICSLAISVIDKYDTVGSLEEFQFFHLRTVLLGSSLLPFILFRLNERVPLITCVLINLLSLLFFDPVHEMLGVGYYQLGFKAPHYYFLNYICVAMGMVLAGCSFFLKYSYETAESKNESLIESLNQANHIIGKQKEMLAKENMQLNQSLVDKNLQLVQTNEELIRHNSDLLQFSYTVSHNLRGPVSSMMGLLNLMDTHEFSGDNQAIVTYLRNATQSLDGTIKDLSSIIDIRNKISRVRQAVDLNEELNHVLVLLQKDMEDSEAMIHRNLQVTTLHTVKPMLGSVLYNLISNAIKYRSSERALTVSVRSRTEGDFTIVEVSDNGLGLDVVRFKDKLFGLYKRFHTHTEGKGLGLFLVKLQVEALGGKIDVTSIINQGTTFSVSFRNSLTEPPGYSLL